MSALVCVHPEGIYVNQWTLYDWLNFFSNFITIQAIYMHTNLIIMMGMALATMYVFRNLSNIRN